MTKQGKKPKKQTRLHEIWVQLKRNKLAVVSMFVLIALVLVAVLAPVLAPYYYDDQNVANKYAKPSAEHPLGTDKLGRTERFLYKINK